MDATEWDARYAGRELIWTADANRFLVEQVADLAPGRALDVAAGEGRNAVWLAEHGWDVTAVDFSRVGVDKGRQLATARDVDVAWQVEDVTRWQPPAAAFDLVVVLYLQLPEPARTGAYRRAASAVAPGGTLLIVGHDVDNLTRGHGGPDDEAVLLSIDRVTGDLAGSGLEVVTARQVERRVETDEGPRTAIDCLVRATRAA